MKKYLLSLITLTLLLCEASFTGGGMAFAATSFALSGTTLTVTGSGAMTNYTSGNYTSVTWNSSRTTITKIVISDGVTTIGNYAFKGCNHVTSVEIPPTVTSVGTDAFSGCSALSEVKFQKNSTYNSSNRTYVSDWANINFANETANPLYYAHRLRYVGQTGYAGGATYGLLDAAQPTLGSSIKDYVFINCTYLTGISIPNTVTTIGKYAFSGCTGLKSVTFNATSQVSTIGEYAFKGCNNSSFTTITIPESVTSMGTGVFVGCSNIRTVNWNARNCADFTYTTGQYASYQTPFYYSSQSGKTTTVNTIADNITTLSFGSSVEHIPAYLCQGMTNNSLTSVTIPASVTSVGTSAFSGCTKLTSVNYLGSIAQWCGITFASSSSNPLYCGKNLKLNGSNFSTLDIPSGVASIGAYQFYNAQNVTTLNIPTTVTYVGIEAFKGCSNITSVNYAGFAADWSRINFSATNEGTCPLYYGEDMLFCNGSKPTSVVVPNGVTKISPYAFYKCTSLTSVTLNDDGSLTQIMNDAFRECTGLTEIIVPNSVTTIAADAFNACTGLTSLTLGSSLVNINASAFNGCTSLAGTLIIPSAVTQISSYAFKNCSSLTGLDLTNASALKTISSSSFTGCTNIAGDLYIPAAVTKIENNAFEDLSGITAIFATPTTAPTAYAATFTNMVKTIPFYVLTSDAFTSYSGNDKWNVFTNMKIGGYCGQADNLASVKWEYNSTTHLLTISGSGAMKDYANSDSNRAPWYDLRTSVNSIKICDGVTHVGEYAFNNCSNATEVSMSPTVNECGSSAFLNCSGLTKVYYGKTNTTSLSYATDWAQIDFGNSTANPLYYAQVLKNVTGGGQYGPNYSNVTSLDNRSITEIKKNAFYGCTSLTSAALPSTVETIGNDAFNGCANIVTVTIPNSVTSIKARAFEGCTSLESVNYGDAPTLATIGLYAFKNCSKLESITIPESVTGMTTRDGSTIASVFFGCVKLQAIEWNARNCGNFTRYWYAGDYNYPTPFSSVSSQIKSITFGPEVRHIPECLCYGMSNTNFTSVSIPASVESIGAYAFDGCSNLASVTCERTATPITSIQSTTFSSPSTMKLYLPHNVAAKAAYRAASGWSSFTEANTFPKIVQFSLNGKSGDAPEPQFFDDLTSKASAPSDPADDDYYVFDKWCSDEEGENPFNFSSTDITADLTLYAKWGLNGTITLREATDNSTKLAAYDGQTVDVNLSRTIRHESYNTICLPFSVSAEQVEAAFGADCDIEEMTGARSNGENIDLVFTQRDAIEAGKPYLIQPTATVENPSFSNVTISKNTITSETDYIDFKGVFSPTVLAQSSDLLFLGASNKLYMSAGGTMNGLRAYFEIHNQVAQQAAAMKRVRLSFNNENSATGIESVQPSEVRSQKYIKNGQLFIERDGKTYNAQGVLVR